MTTQNTATSHPSYKINPAVAHREIEDQILLMIPGHSDLFTLNKTGSLVWRSLVAGETLESIILTIADQFAISSAQARQDVEALIEDLLAHNVIVPAE